MVKHPIRVKQLIDIPLHPYFVCVHACVHASVCVCVRAYVCEVKALTTIAACIYATRAESNHLFPLYPTLLEHHVFISFRNFISMSSLRIYAIGSTSL